MATGFRTSSMKLSKNIRRANLEESIKQSRSLKPIVKSIMEDLTIRGIDKLPRFISLESACHLAFPDSAQTPNPTRSTLQTLTSNIPHVSHGSGF